MKNGIVLMLMVFFMGSAFAQGTAPFQKEDVAAMEITAAVQKQLTQEVWNCYDRVFVDREGYTSKQGMPRLFLKADGTFVQGDTKGRWKVEGKNMLKIMPERTRLRGTGREVLEGAYAVYNIDENHLTLVKVLTSSSDMVISYHFESETGRMARLEKAWKAETYEEKQERLKKASSDKMSDNVELEKEEKIIFKNKVPKQSSEKTSSSKTIDTSKMSDAELFMRGLKRGKSNN